MKLPALSVLLTISALTVPVVAIGTEDGTADRSHPAAFVKDSVITTKVKAKLAAEHITSLGRIHVDTDADGVVWLRGTARTWEAADKAASIARATEGVTDVRSHISVRQDD